ncbi:hypothetical protein EV363DRAFT_1447083 [Boletus edulis]|nr:hypothetical protein EV363DRAFT_1447083 [Boletus edulis]
MTSKSLSILMPNHNIESVRELFYETRMSHRDFRALTLIVRLTARKYLDDSGCVPAEKQDPAAFRQFLDQVNICDPTIADRYPYSWPVLAYLELYLCGRRRTYCRRNPDDTTKPPPQHKFVHRTPIYIRYSRSVKTGRPFREIAVVWSDRLSYLVSCSDCRRANRCKMVPNSDVDESRPAVVVDNNNALGRFTPPPEPANKFVDPVKPFWQSLGSSIGDICSRIVGG